MRKLLLPENRDAVSLPLSDRRRIEFTHPIRG